MAARNGGGSVLERAKEHFAGLAEGSMEIPEWGKDGKPLVVTWRRMTMQDRIELNLGQRLQQFDLEVYVDVVQRMARDAEGSPLFHKADRVELRRAVDPAVLTRLGDAMLGIATPEQAEGN